MSDYVSPFLVLNLGAEMVFVIAQRLQAHDVPRDRASLDTAPNLKWDGVALLLCTELQY